MHGQRRAGRLAAVAVLAGSLVGVLWAQVRGSAMRGLQPDDATVAPTTQPMPPESGPAPIGGDQRAGAAQLVSGLIGSKHDFRRLNAEVRDLCLPCHTPHLREPPVPRLDRRPTSTQPLRAYRQLDVELSGWSLLCLGCHDGVTASDVYTSTHAVTLVEPLRRTGLGSRGLRSHPVGVKYPTGRTDYHPPATVEARGLMLPDGRIQCTTCHDAHNTHGYDGFLWISNQRSTLCLTCHRL